MTGHPVPDASLKDISFFHASEGKPLATPWQVAMTRADYITQFELPPGMVLPNQVHGGPGRAGGGEELGGLRGLDLYTNRMAVQGDRGLLSKILGEKLKTIDV